MPQPFRFKQFSVADDRCGQKVGTDSILLGSWATADNAIRILDIGTGCGLLGLMLAQRFPSSAITAIEIDQSACAQAQRNFLNSPWSDRLAAQPIDARKFAATLCFDLIVCNPPYFEASLKPDNVSRSTARHNDQLTFAELANIAATVLGEQGRFSVVLPMDRASEFIDAAASCKLHLKRRCDVRPTPETAPKRSLLDFGQQRPHMIDSSELTLEVTRHQYTAGYIELAKDFLLKM